jgi:hypothetical protein
MRDLPLNAGWMSEYRSFDCPLRVGRKLIESVSELASLDSEEKLRDVDAVSIPA